jgi:hypothetical protein
MSNLFFDHLIEFDKLEKSLSESAYEHEEKLELWQFIDTITHYRIINLILTLLPEKHHFTFLSNYQEAPFDHELLDFLNKKSQEDIEEKLKKETESLALEILELLQTE